jgi:hypothetical protein
MFNATGYKHLDIYKRSKQLVVACYELTHDLPSEEKTNFARYIRVAALNFHVNVAQVAFLKPEKREEFIQNAINALIIIDAAIDILLELELASREQTRNVTTLSSLCYQLLDAL